MKQKSLYRHEKISRQKADRKCPQGDSEPMYIERTVRRGHVLSEWPGEGEKP